jgi:hypothetical protein
MLQALFRVVLQTLVPRALIQTLVPRVLIQALLPQTKIQVQVLFRALFQVHAQR